MTMKRTVVRMGGSLGVVIPKALSELVGLADGSEVSLSVVGRQIVIEPTDDTIPDETYRRSLGAMMLFLHANGARLTLAVDPAQDAMLELQERAESGERTDKLIAWLAAKLRRADRARGR